MSPEFSCLRGIPITELSLMRSRRSAAFLAFLIFACSLMLAACSKSEPAKNGQDGAGQRAVARPLLVFMTDFGTANDAVAICKAVMVGIAPDIRIMDITHQVTPFSIEVCPRRARLRERNREPQLVVGGGYLFPVSGEGFFLAGWGASGSGVDLHAGRPRGTKICPANPKARHCDRQGHRRRSDRAG